LNKNTNILFVVSKSTGYIALKSFLEQSESQEVSVLVLDDREDVRSCFELLLGLCETYKVEPIIAKGKKCLGEAIISQKPRLVFVCGWYWLIPENILSLVPLGVLGIHNSLLPKYRGHAPLVWSMINGDKDVGSSLFKIEAGMDTGRVFHQWKVESEGRYLTEVLRDLDLVIESSFGAILSDILIGHANGVEQEHQQASYSAKRREEDGVVNWNDLAQNTVLKIRALSSPYPNAFTFIQGRKVRLLKAEVFEYPSYGAPGQVVFCDQSYAVISCGNQQGVKITQAIDLEGQTNIPKLFSKLSSPPTCFELNNNTCV